MGPGVEGGGLGRPPLLPCNKMFAELDNQSLDIPSPFLFHGNGGGKPEPGVL